MKSIVFFATFLLSILFFTNNGMAAIKSAKPSVMGNTENIAVNKQQQKLEKRLDRFQQKLKKKINKWKKKGLYDASFDLETVGWIVIALGGLFILLGILTPYVGILFTIIGAIIAFAGVVALLVLDGVSVTAEDSPRTR